MPTDQEIDDLIAVWFDNATAGGDENYRRRMRAVLAAAQAKPDTGRMVALEHHNRLTSHGMQWTDQRLDANGLNCARAVFGTCNEDDDKRVYRTIQAYLSAAQAKPEPEGAKSGPAVAALTKPQREAVFASAAAACDADHNLSWRDAIVTAVESAHRIPAPSGEGGA